MLFRSIWVDFEAGRPLELDAAVKAPLELAQLRGVETPLMKAHYALLLAKLVRRERLKQGPI